MSDAKSCEQCGAEHTKKRFCSAPCYNKWKKGKKIGGYAKKPRPSCLHCGKECKRSTTKYCSAECYGAYRSKHNIRVGGPKRNVKERPCQHCGTVFFPKDYKDKQKFCTQRCMGLARADEMAALGRAKKGTKMSLEQREKLSIIASNRNANQDYTKGKGGTREDVGHYVRSSWEANVARVLKHEGIEYNYEPKTFVLQKPDGSNTRYTPDFYALGHYLEVKGWWDHRSLEKKRLMAEQYPEVYIEYIDEPLYNELKKEYQHELRWE